jgi:hypothetical protein
LYGGGSQTDIEGDDVMWTIRKFGVSVAACGLALAYSSGANAQATRTWVSGVGDDVNPCSRTAPCKTFATAISKTAAGGEINCLDPGGFGAVTINKSITISCPYTEGGALAGGNGIVVNDGTTGTPGTAVVVIRGLDIFGVSPPSNGVRFVSGAALHIEDSVIRRFNAANSFGVSFQPNSQARLYITNTTITQNGTTGSGGGILIQPTGAAGASRVFMEDVRVMDNANQGLRVDMTGNTAAFGTIVDIDDSEFVNNNNGIIVNAPAGTTAAVVMVANSNVSNNAGTGISASGSSLARIRVGTTTITGNGTGVTVGAGTTINTYGNNRNDGNGVNGSFTLPAIPES